MPLNFDLPLLNSASPWATTYEDLKSLYFCPSIGAITTRTSLINGFNHDPIVHQHCFVSTTFPSIIFDKPNSDSSVSNWRSKGNPLTSLNTYGYSPHPLSTYLDWIPKLLQEAQTQQDAPISRKPIILSVTGTPAEISQAYTTIADFSHNLNLAGSFTTILIMEINLSCPNISSKPPPAYSKSFLQEYLSAVSQAQQASSFASIPVGIKTPPYTYSSQFSDLISALLASCSTNHDGSKCRINFITATNTLGSSLLLAPSTQGNGEGNNPYVAALNSEAGTGIGGLAGVALHPIALGNVATLRRILDKRDELKGIDIIGVGGVTDREGYERMRSVGAAAVGVATALGVEGVGVFERILGRQDSTTGTEAKS